MKIKLLVLFLLALSLLSCKSEIKKSNSNTSEEKEEVSVESITLKLNNGEKWIANKETHVGVTKMDSIISAFKHNTDNDYIILGELLSIQTSSIIKNCTMKGESHDQLHVVLVPMLDEISSLKETDKKTKETSLEKLEVLIQKYFEHFKT